MEQFNPFKKDNAPERDPVEDNESHKYDEKGNPRTHYEMVEGDMFFGSQEEYQEELQNRRAEGKN